MRGIHIHITGRIPNEREVQILLNSCEKERWNRKLKKEEIKNAIRLAAFEGWKLKDIMMEISSINRRSLQKRLESLGKKYLGISLTFTVLRSSWILSCFNKGYTSEWIATNAGLCDGSIQRYKRKIAGYISEKKRYQVLKRDKFRCTSCGNDRNLQVDHIIPVSKKGKSRLKNLQTLCAKCNIGKSDTL